MLIGIIAGGVEDALPGVVVLYPGDEDEDEDPHSEGLDNAKSSAGREHGDVDVSVVTPGPRSGTELSNVLQR